MDQVAIFRTFNENTSRLIKFLFLILEVNYCSLNYLLLTFCV